MPATAKKRTAKRTPPPKIRTAKKVQAEIPVPMHRQIVDLAGQQHSTVRNVVAHAVKLGMLQMASDPDAVAALPRDGRIPAEA